jgi:hypothetical protein
VPGDVQSPVVEEPRQRGEMSEERCRASDLSLAVRDACAHPCACTCERFLMFATPQRSGPLKVEQSAYGCRHTRQGMRSLACSLEHFVETDESEYTEHVPYRPGPVLGSFHE